MLEMDVEFEKIYRLSLLLKDAIDPFSLKQELGTIIRLVLFSDMYMYCFQFSSNIQR